ncbi:MAG TPA: mechanosensitive ion channel family protein [Cytophagaceae bacterium]|jgi:small-conductance mechanosensitive channel
MFLKYIFNITYFTIVIVATILVATLVKKLLNRFFLRSSSFIKTDPTNYKFLKHFISFLIYLIGFGIAIYAIPSLRTLSLSLFTGAGIFAAIIGFASQQAFANIINGIFIIIFKPFRVDDHLEVRNNISGVVEDITLRHTILKSGENKRIMIPNSIIGQEIIINSNIIDERICKSIEFVVMESTDINLASRIISQQCADHPLTLDLRLKQEVESGQEKVPVRLVGFQNGSIILRAYFWAANLNNATLIGWELNRSIKERFDESRIKMGSPTQTILMQAGEFSIDQLGKN